MEIERYSLKINQEKVVSRVIEERINKASLNLSMAEKIIREKLREKANEFNLCLLLGNSVKSIEERIEFLKILKEKGMEEKDLEMVKKLIEEASFLVS